ncbi:hypothetical protein [Thiothrix lacustris]|uniref:hypothetical protein n=1 Tax=Thiothrix lacustris TaxID=525917 RepID=UPI00048CE709|nr:hypothetical protein [Thiothrix lacustris]
MKTAQQEHAERLFLFNLPFIKGQLDARHDRLKTLLEDFGEGKRTFDIEMELAVADITALMHVLQTPESADDVDLDDDTCVHDLNKQGEAP